MRGFPSPLISGKIHCALVCAPSFTHPFTIPLTDNSLWGVSSLATQSVSCTPVASTLPGSLQECRLTHWVRICPYTRPVPLTGWFTRTLKLKEQTPDRPVVLSCGSASPVPTHSHWKTPSGDFNGPSGLRATVSGWSAVRGQGLIRPVYRLASSSPKFAAQCPGHSLYPQNYTPKTLQDAPTYLPSKENKNTNNRGLCIAWNFVNL